MKQKFSFFSLVFVAATSSIFIGITSCNKDATQSKTSASSVANASTDNLVAWYTFNGDAKDHSGNGNDVTFNNATLTAGKDGTPNTAYLFNGTSSYMSIPNSTSLNPTGAITIVAVIQPLGFYQGQCHSNRIISKGADDNDNGRYNMGYDDQPYWNYQGCDLQVKDTKESFYSSYGDGHASASGVTDLAVHVKQNKWYTLAYTYDGKRSTFYVNGMPQAASVNTATFTPENNPVYIGRNQDPNFPYYFNGVIDEIRIYNTALNQNKLQQFNP